MKKITNGARKMVCIADPVKRLVEIKHRGQKTVIEFKEGGTMKVINSREQKK